MPVRSLICLLFFFTCTQQAQAIISATITAPGTGLQAALDAAKPGDTIMVKAGLYKLHNVLVRNPVHLVGEGFPVFDGEGKYETFIVTSGRVYIAGIEIRNTGRSSLSDMAGIRLQDVSNVTINNCRFYNTTYAVYLQNSSWCTISDNRIQAQGTDELQSGNGVHAWKSSHLLIRNNVINGHRDGIYFEFVTESRIEKNISFNNIRYGLHFMFSHHDTYSGNTFRNNGAGVAVMYSKGVDMQHNHFDHNWGDAAYGILLKEISDSRISGNVFQKNTMGLYMEGCSRIRVYRNTFSANGWAMRIQANCDGNRFEVNNFTGNSFDVATNGSMVLNVFQDNYWDKYEGYDLDKDGTGDVPYYPVSVYAVITERIPAAMILYRSFLTNVMDQAEKVMPSIIPDQLKDSSPKMKKWPL